MREELKEKIKKEEITSENYTEWLDDKALELEKHIRLYVLSEMIWGNVLKNKVNVAIVDRELLEHIKEQVRKSNPEMLEKGLVEFKTL